MLMVAPDEGKVKLLAWLLTPDGETAPDLTLRLFSNDYTPDNDSEAGDFTESTFGGYSAIAILRSQMGPPAIVGHVAYTTRSTVPVFSCTSGSAQDCWGWYLTDDDDDTVVLAQRFDHLRTMAPGASEKIDPFKVALQTLH